VLSRCSLDYLLSELPKLDLAVAGSLELVAKNDLVLLHLKYCLTQALRVRHQAVVVLERSDLKSV